MTKRKQNPHPSPLPEGEGAGEGSRWPSLQRYVALVTLERGGVFILPGEAVELDAPTAWRLQEMGMVAIWPGGLGIETTGGQGLDTPEGLDTAGGQPTRPAEGGADGLRANGGEDG